MDLSSKTRVEDAALSLHDSALCSLQRPKYSTGPSYMACLLQRSIKILAHARIGSPGPTSNLPRLWGFSGPLRGR